MSARKKRLPPGDDGHTIAPMNVEGMPWYDGSPAQKTQAEGQGEAPQPFPLSREETRWWMAGALRAALLVGAVFAVGILLLVGLMLWIW